jgi:hypothetical protein
MEVESYNLNRSVEYVVASVVGFIVWLAADPVFALATLCYRLVAQIPEASWRFQVRRCSNCSEEVLRQRGDAQPVRRYSKCHSCY